MSQDKIHEIYDHLTSTALKQGRRSYADFAREVGLSLPGDFDLLVRTGFDRINMALHDYKDQYWSAGYPMLSAVVVQNYLTDATSGSGFFDCARQSGWIIDEGEKKFHADQLAKVYRVQRWPDFSSLNLQP
jgi:hypothetical protein